MALQGLADPAGRITNDAPGLQLAIALGASVYLLSERKRVPRGEHHSWSSQPASCSVQSRSISHSRALQWPQISALMHHNEAIA